jgi:hypothetical protein
MHQKFISLFYLLLITIFAACSSLPTPEKMKSATADFALPAMNVNGKAVIYIVRPSSAGAFIKFNVFLDNKDANSEMGYNRGNQHFYFYADPGKHIIYSKAENWAEIAIDVKKSDVVFLKQNTEFGVIMARTSMEKIPYYEGKYHVMQTNSGTTIKTKK